MTSSRGPSMESYAATSVRTEMFLTVAELCALAGLSERQLVRLLRLGIIEPSAPGSAQFTAATARRLKRMMRLRQQLGVGSIGASIIVDLLDRLADLEARLARR
jgi:hypothetical protein